MSADVPKEDGQESLVGAVLADRYLVLGLMGEGGMGQVYAARHVGLDKRVAIKVLTRWSAVPDAATRFLREARMMADIDHPNVARVTDFGETDGGLLYLVMEYVHGEDLATTLASVRRMSWPRLRHIVLQVARGLGHAHAKGIVHRDVKPENILRVAGEDDVDFVKVIDFGIAREASAASGRLTRSGAVVGTPEYMAPEQSRSSKVDRRVDIYALGIVAYELLVGTVPFSGDDFMEVLWRHASDPLVPPSQVVEGIPPAADAFVMRACAKDPAERFQTMEELVEFVEGDLAPVFTARTDFELARPVAAHAPDRSGALVAGGVVAGLLVAGVASIVAMRWLDRDTPDEPAAVVEVEPLVPERLPEPIVAVGPKPDVAPLSRPEAVEAPEASARPGWARSRVLHAIQPGVSACVGGIMGGAHGERVRVRITVATTGGVQRARPLGEHAGTAVGKCVAAAAKQATFPPFAGKSISFTHTFKL